MPYERMRPTQIPEGTEKKPTSTEMERRYRGILSGIPEGTIKKPTSAEMTARYAGPLPEIPEETEAGSKVTKIPEGPIKKK